MADELKVFTFGPLHGLPTSGPFGLKLELALRIAGVPYQRVYEEDNRKGPKRKSPWIEQGSVRMGDTTLILEHLGVDLDGHLSPIERAQGLVLRRMLEEHWHQVLEYELFVHPAGLQGLDEPLGRLVPGFLVPALRWYLRRNFRLHLFERGIARHTPEDVESMGKADLDALATWMRGREWAVGDAPSITDCTVFGLLAPALWSPTPTPCFTYVKTLDPLVDYVERIRGRWFADEIPPLARPLPLAV